MILDKKVVVVMPAYNAAGTLIKTYNEVMSQGVVDHVILVDDRSSDDTVKIAREIEGVQVSVHDENLGYGGNQKSCYRLALEAGADIIVMVHPDYQYTPFLIPSMASLVSSGLFPMVMGSRILGGHALSGGMPAYKYVANRFLTMTQNLLFGAKLSEYHSGYRAYSRELLESIDFTEFSNDFLFDNQFIAQVLWNGWKIGEITCPTKYFPEASSISIKRSAIYGLGCLKVGLGFALKRFLRKINR
jgi:glycosyltransferase involved in cell wall biosynthesis